MTDAPRGSLCGRDAADAIDAVATRGRSADAATFKVQKTPITHVDLHEEPVRDVERKSFCPPNLRYSLADVAPVHRSDRLSVSTFAGSTSRSRSSRPRAGHNRRRWLLLNHFLRRSLLDDAPSRFFPTK